ncbi:MAG: hypothetical protein Q8S20_21240 [Sulfuritalea sp.]|nr:hypothetical protein [Sulfuritalea sp.]
MLRFVMRFFSLASTLRFSTPLLAVATAAAQAQVTLSATPLTQEQVSAFYIARLFGDGDCALRAGLRAVVRVSQRRPIFLALPPRRLANR